MLAVVLIGPLPALRDNEPMKNGRTSPQGKAQEPDNGIRRDDLSDPDPRPTSVGLVVSVAHLGHEAMTARPCASHRLSASSDRSKRSSACRTVSAAGGASRLHGTHVGAGRITGGVTDPAQPVSQARQPHVTDINTLRALERLSGDMDHLP